MSIPSCLISSIHHLIQLARRKQCCTTTASPISKPNDGHDSRHVFETAQSTGNIISETKLDRFFFLEHASKMFVEKRHFRWSHHSKKTPSAANRHNLKRYPIHSQAFLKPTLFRNDVHLLFLHCFFGSHGLTIPLSRFSRVGLAQL